MLKMALRKKFFVTFLYLFLFNFISTADYDITYNGAPNPDGLIKDCKMFSDSKIEVKLSKLHLSVTGSDGFATPYDYYHVAELLRHPAVDFRKKTFVFVGTYMDMTSIPLGGTMAKLYRHLGYNALVLHYMEFSNWKNFAMAAAARQMRPVSRYAAEMLAKLTTLGLDPKKLELVGLGLGGQTMSFIAKDYRKITGQNISMLIGLDPAGSCFRTLGPRQRLDPSDADFVLSIGTNIDGRGIATPVGHVTFYVNGGEYQPADVWFLPCEVYCSHIRAYYLWISALLNPGEFIGIKCDTIQQARENDCHGTRPRVTNTMDMRVDKNKTGIYYVATGNKYPYALGKVGLRKTNNALTQFLASGEYLRI